MSEPDGFIDWALTSTRGAQRDSTPSGGQTSFSARIQTTPMRADKNVCPPAYCRVPTSIILAETSEPSKTFHERPRGACHRPDSLLGHNAKRIGPLRQNSPPIHSIEKNSGGISIDFPVRFSDHANRESGDRRQIPPNPSTQFIPLGRSILTDFLRPKRIPGAFPKMSDRGFSPLALRVLLAFCMTIVLATIPACSDPEGGSMPKMKKSKSETLNDVEGPERVSKKKVKTK